MAFQQFQSDAIQIGVNGLGSDNDKVRRVVGLAQESRAAELIGYGLIVVTSALLLSATVPPASAHTIFGTHEAVVRQADNRSWVQGQNPALFAAPPKLNRPIAFVGEQSRDVTGYALVFRQQPGGIAPAVLIQRVSAPEQAQDARGSAQIYRQQSAPLISELVVRKVSVQPQTDPTQIAAQIFKQQPAGAIPDTPPNRPTKFAGQQYEPDRQQPRFDHQAPPTTVPPSAPNRPIPQAGQQSEPDRQQPWFDHKKPASAALQSLPNRPARFSAGPQQERELLQPWIDGQTPATAQKTVSSAIYRFGTHELAVRESQWKGNIWHGIIPSAVIQIVAHPTFFAGQQLEPDRQQPLIIRGAAIASASVQTPPLHPTFFAGQHVEPDRQQALFTRQAVSPFSPKWVYAVGQQFPPEVLTAFMTQIGPPEPLGISAYFSAGQQSEPDRLQPSLTGQQPPSATVQNAPNRPTFFVGQQGEAERIQPSINRQAPPPTAPTPPPNHPTFLAGQHSEPDRQQPRIDRQQPQRLEIGQRAFFAGQQGEPDRLQAVFAHQPPVSIAPETPPLRPMFFVGQQFDDGRDIPSKTWSQQPPGAPFVGTTTVVDKDVRFGQVVGVVSVSFGQTTQHDVIFTNLLTRDVEF